MWVEGRIHGDFDALTTPIGKIPKYDDLKLLFEKVFALEYTKERYEKEFGLQTDRFLEKIVRIEQSYSTETELPKEFFFELNAQKQRLIDAQKQFGKIEISPFAFGS